ncbi:unnamed protein product [Linum tenue]|uniref:Uncharacterized protein n=1 Tax=Linum tenue TaxID=586396 RepID=A0AAV0LLV1_9ROSI|nr:unnamed protein product [Linum tenue]
MKQKSRNLPFNLLSTNTLNIISDLVQHYDFAVMSKKQTKRVREKLLEKLMTFEIGCFNEDENSRAAITRSP